MNNYSEGANNSEHFTLSTNISIPHFIFSSVNILHLQISSKLLQPNPKCNCFYNSFLCIRNMSLYFTLYFTSKMYFITHIEKDWWSMAVILVSKDLLRLCFRKKRQIRHFVPRAVRFSERVHLNLGKADWHRLNSTPLLPCTFPSGENIIYLYIW